MGKKGGGKCRWEGRISSSWCRHVDSRARVLGKKTPGHFKELAFPKNAGKNTPDKAGMAFRTLKK